MDDWDSVDWDAIEARALRSQAADKAVLSLPSAPTATVPRRSPKLPRPALAQLQLLAGTSQQAPCQQPLPHVQANANGGGCRPMHTHAPWLPRSANSAFSGCGPSSASGQQQAAGASAACVPCPHEPRAHGAEPPNHLQHQQGAAASAHGRSDVGPGHVPAGGVRPANAPPLPHYHQPPPPQGLWLVPGNHAPRQELHPPQPHIDWQQQRQQQQAPQLAPPTAAAGPMEAQHQHQTGHAPASAVAPAMVQQPGTAAFVHAAWPHAAPAAGAAPSSEHCAVPYGGTLHPPPTGHQPAAHDTHATCAQGGCGGADQDQVLPAPNPFAKYAGTPPGLKRPPCGLGAMPATQFRHSPIQGGKGAAAAVAIAASEPAGVVAQQLPPAAQQQGPPVAGCPAQPHVPHAAAAGHGGHAALPHGHAWQAHGGGMQPVPLPSQLPQGGGWAPQRHAEPHRPNLWQQAAQAQAHHAQQHQLQHQHRQPAARHTVGTLASAPAGAHPQARQQQKQQEDVSYQGRCPYERCPGVYQPCNAVLRWYDRSHLGEPGFWGCQRYPDCDYRYYPHARLPTPVLSIEVVGSDMFKVGPYPGAEQAVHESGGVACVLAGARLDLSAALSMEDARARLQRQTLGHANKQGSSAPSLPLHDPAVTAAAAVAADAAAAAPAELGGPCGDARDAAATGTAPDGLPAADAVAAGSSASGGGGEVSRSAPGPVVQLDSEALYFPLNAYEKLMRHAPTRCSTFTVGSHIPEPVLRAYRGHFQQRATPEEVAARMVRMPGTLAAALMPFQREGVEFALARNGRCLLADEMGVGKTVQAIATASCYEDEWPLLVIVPASLRLVWAEELEKWLPHLRPSDIHVIEGKANRLSGRQARGQALPRVTITSYEMMRRLTCPACCKMRAQPADQQQQQQAEGQGPGAQAPRGRTSGSSAQEPCWGPDRCMAAMAWGMVVVDESHNLRTTNMREHDSPHTEACIAAAQRARRCMMLSGTPSLSRPYDLFRQVDALCPSLLGASKQAFAFRYCDGRLVPRRNPAHFKRGWAGGGQGHGQGADDGGASRPKRLDTAGGSRLSELHGLLVREVMVRRLKRDVMAQLPPKRRQVVRLPRPRVWPSSTNPAASVDADAATTGEADKQQQQPEGPLHQRRAAADAAGEGEAQRPAPQASGAGKRKAAQAPAAAGAAPRKKKAKSSKGAAASADAGKAGAGTAAGGAGDAAGDAQEPDGSAGTGEADEDEDGDDEGQDEDELGGGPGRMTAAHRTALAKLPDAMEWLMGALGANQTPAAGESEGRPAKGQAGKAAGRAPGGSGAGGAVSVPSDAVQPDLEDGLTERLPKFLVFAHHRDVMDRIAEGLQGFALSEEQQEAAEGEGRLRSAWRGVAYVRIDGSHDSAERRTAVMRFRDDPTVRVALLSITAAAVGLDFSSAGAVVFVELPNEVSMLQQAEDRAHRPGQAHTCVNVYYLCAKGTCDDRRWMKLNESLANVNQVHDGCVAHQHQGAPETAQQQGAGGSAGSADAAFTAEEADLLPPESAAAACQGGRQGRALAVEAVMEVDVCRRGGGVAAMGNAVADAARAALGDPSRAVRMSHKRPDGADGTNAAGAAAGGDPTPALLPRAGSSGGGRNVVDQSLQRLLTATHGSFSELTVPALPSCIPATASATQGGSLTQLGGTQLGSQLAGTQGWRKALLASLPPRPAVFFEVSAHTGRVHLHLAPDGSAPAGLSLPLELLLAPPNSAMMRTLMSQYAARYAAVAAASPLPAPAPVFAAASAPSSAPQPQAEVCEELCAAMPSLERSREGGAPAGLAASVETAAHSRVTDKAVAVSTQLPAAASADGSARSTAAAAAVGFVGPCGLVAVPFGLPPTHLAEALAEAQAFARDWRELRAVSRNRLLGRVLERYFQDALEAVTAEAEAAGAYGSSTARYMQDAPLKVPEGAELQPVQVKSYNVSGVWDGGYRQFHQAFTAPTVRLCLNCTKPVADCSLLAVQALDNTDYLFCDPGCETKYFHKTSGSALRRTLWRLEHGVCQMCGLDCTNLVRQLQSIRANSKDYLAKRRLVVERLAPRLAGHGYTAHLDRLLRQATEGMAWQADHIRPVYLGGGLCDIDNMRTLCTACHADVTKAQAKSRAAERAQKALGTRDIRTFWGQGASASAGAGGAAATAASNGGAAPKPAVPANKRKRPAVLRSSWVSEDGVPDAFAVGQEAAGGGGCNSSAAQAVQPAKPEAKRPRLPAKAAPTAAHAIAGKAVCAGAEDAQALGSTALRRQAAGVRLGRMASTPMEMAAPAPTVKVEEHACSAGAGGHVPGAGAGVGAAGGVSGHDVVDLLSDSSQDSGLQQAQGGTRAPPDVRDQQTHQQPWQGAVSSRHGSDTSSSSDGGSPGSMRMGAPKEGEGRHAAALALQSAHATAAGAPAPSQGQEAAAAGAPAPFQGQEAAAAADGEDGGMADAAGDAPQPSQGTPARSWASRLRHVVAQGRGGGGSPLAADNDGPGSRRLQEEEEAPVEEGRDGAAVRQQQEPSKEAQASAVTEVQAQSCTSSPRAGDQPLAVAVGAEQERVLVAPQLQGGGGSGGGGGVVAPPQGGWHASQAAAPRVSAGRALAAAPAGGRLALKRPRKA